MRRLGLLVAALVLLARIAGPADRSAEARPVTDELLRVTGHITYDVRPDAGPVNVSWQVNLENNDPETAFREVGFVYFYEAVTLPVLRGASSVRASGPGGGSLTVNVQDPGEGPIVVVEVNLDRNLYYGQSYSFTLSYQLPEARSDFLLITPFYVFLPAITAGDSSTVTITMPDNSAWDVTLETAECSQSGSGEYQCGASEDIQVAALVEVSRPDALKSSESAVALSESELSLTIRYFPGEETWAFHIQELATAALPVMEDIFGIPYQGPTDLEISERGRQDIAGYEGTFGCVVIICHIGISPMADDRVAVHEFAHLWTGVFDRRWLAEGLAEFTASRTLHLLGPLPSISEIIPPEHEVDLQLDEWEPIGILIGASDEEQTLEVTGYLKSLRFFELLDKTVGLDALRAANAAAAIRGNGVDSRAYLDILEEAGGVRLDALFLEWVFPSSFEPILEQRRRVSDRLAKLDEAAGSAGLNLPESIENAVADWRFESANRTMEEAEAAIAAHTAARDKVDRPRSLWQKIGLLGSDSEGALADAVAAFAAGDFQDVIESSEDAQGMIDGAGTAALMRLLIALGILAAIVTLGAGGIWFFRRRRASG
jgi:hypothetical protein